MNWYIVRKGNYDVCRRLHKDDTSAFYVVDCEQWGEIWDTFSREERLYIDNKGVIDQNPYPVKCHKNRPRIKDYQI